jgi:hypothetical protein
MFPELTTNQLETIVDAIRGFFADRSSAVS